MYDFSCEIIFGQLLKTFGDFFLVTLLERERVSEGVAKLLIQVQTKNGKISHSSGWGILEGCQVECEIFPMMMETTLDEKEKMANLSQPLFPEGGFFALSQNCCEIPQIKPFLCWTPVWFTTPFTYIVITYPARRVILLRLNKVKLQ